jgi:glycosyltransferase involved in cell wall biosynthesis
MKYIKNIDPYNLIDLSDDCLQELIKNGPYLPDLIEKFFSSANSDYKLIHTTFFPYFNLVIGLILGKLLDIPVIVTPFFHFSNPRYLEPSIIEVLTKFDLIIACTHIEKRTIANITGVSEEKIIVIPMGVDNEKFETTPKSRGKEYYFKEHYFKKNEKKHKLVLYCGYKNFEKGALSVLKSIPYVLREVKKAYFVFIGPTTMAYNRELSNLGKKCRNKIINLTPDNLSGYFDRKKIAAFKEADLYLMPSRSDAFGISFLEAWAAGKPVIGANIGATPHVINNGIDGFLVEFNNPKDISEKVVKLLKSKRLRKSFGTAGKEKVRINYTWDLIAERTHETYQHLINVRD